MLGRDFAQSGVGGGVERAFEFSDSAHRRADVLGRMVRSVFLVPDRSLGEGQAPRAVPRQVDFRGRSLQPALPESDLPMHFAGSVRGRVQMLPLPQAEVDVGHGELIELGRFVAYPGRIGGREIAGQGRQRPTVRGDVVHDHDQGVVFGRRTEQHGAQRRLPGDVEGA